MTSRKLIDYVIIGLKGMAMGAADVVPGVSGGTIAFISGIYEELITSINNIKPSLFKTLKNEGFKSFWEALNGNFLLALFSGILLSVFSLAKFLSWLLENQPVLLWSFFFGLVLASVFLIGKQIGKWSLTNVLFLLGGATVAYIITTLPVNENVAGLPFLFLSGALAVCAMILPGISGAFILVLLGSYKTILDGVHERDVVLVITVVLGAVFGLLSFARLLKWMFKKFKDLTLALLTGFIIGSLAKIWPWKEVLRSKIFDDKVIPVEEKNIWPTQFDGDPQILWASALAVLGFSLIFILERVASKK
ncbi:DUF368 domain-containing protein [Flagellimonas sp. DF-77]|uniref:DUF368 domain-containing protein n=1 Tax=Flagellimonas algarum TaxID=3230298 RepID=UPI0033913B16